MPEGLNEKRDGLFESYFDDQERTALRGAFGRGDTNAITEQLTAKGITAEGDKQEILEALAGESAMPKMNDWVLKLAILNIIKAIQASEIKITWPQFRKMIGGAYEDLKDTEQLTAKGITAEGDKQKILEALAGDNPEVTADDLKKIISDLKAPKDEGHLGADSDEDTQTRTPEEKAYLFSRVIMAYATGKSAMPKVNDWVLKLAILNVTRAIRASGINVAWSQFEKMVGGAYKGLKDMEQDQAPILNFKN